LQQFQRDLEVLQARHGWTIQEETTESEKPAETETKEEEVVPAQTEPTHSAEDLQILLAEKECIFEELNQSMGNAISMDDYETAATIQDEVDSLKEEIDALQAQLAELGTHEEAEEAEVSAAAVEAAAPEEAAEISADVEIAEVSVPEVAIDASTEESTEPLQIQPEKALADPPDGDEVLESSADNANDSRAENEKTEPVEAANEEEAV